MTDTTALLPADVTGPVAFDVETSGLFVDDGARVASIAIAWFGPDGDIQSVAMPFDQGIRDKLPHVQLDMLEGDDPNLDQAEWDQTLDWLDGRQLIAHNAKFDITQMRAGTRHWAGRSLLDSLHMDTSIVAHELDPILSISLDAAADRAGLGGKTGLDSVKGWLKANKLPTNRYDLVPWYIIEPYVRADAELTLQLYREQEKRWKDPELGRLREQILREHELLRTLCLIEWRGVAYNAGVSLEAAERLEARATEIESKMPFRCEVNDAKRWFFDKQGLEPDRRTDSGNPSLDEEQVRKWVAQEVEWADEYYQVSRARRAVSMWYQGYPDKIGPDGRLRCSYRQTKVRSGRMSVERVQLQALPKADKYSAVGSSETLTIYEEIPGVRDLIHAEDGMGLWSLDMSQAELRVAAKYSGCGPMLELLEGGADFHGETCKDVMQADPDDPNWKFQRDIAKRLTFGSIFQVGGETFQATLSKLANIDLPLADCTRMVRAWRNKYPEITSAYRKAERVAKAKGCVPILPGTGYESRSYFGPRDWPNTAWNRIVQGSLAAFLKMWLIDVEEQCPGAMILTIHDSVLLELPLDKGDAIAAAVAGRARDQATALFGLEMPCDIDRWD